jgi:hypothetical protein
VTKIVTASYRAWTPGLGQPVVTSLTRPKWLPEAADWPNLWPVTPRWSFFRAEPAEFERAYIAQLNRYGPKAIAECLAEITRQTGRPDRLVLLCWEWGGADRGRDRCHRGLWAAWWLETTGEVVEEVNIPCVSAESPTRP